MWENLNWMSLEILKAEELLTTFPDLLTKDNYFNSYNSYKSYNKYYQNLLKNTKKEYMIN